MARRFALKTGMTLIELLVVIAIIGVLIQLLIPAVAMSREAARRATCANQLRQLDLGIKLHLTAQGHYPSGGWGSFWVGDPDRGTGTDQPGSWAYNTLSYIEQEALRELGQGQQGDAREKAISEACQTPIPLFYCPTRRAPLPYPRSNSQAWLTLDGNRPLPIEQAARSDYAVNTGDHAQPQAGGDEIPTSYLEASDPGFKWFDTSNHTGISFGRSRVEPKQVIDGLSKTYMVGEKFIPIWYYDDGQFKADNECMYSGFDNDNGRTAKDPPQHDATAIDDLLGKTRFVNAFGSAHPSVWQVVLCDGSAHSLSFDIDPEVHKKMANRRDGEVNNEP